VPAVLTNSARPGLIGRGASVIVLARADMSMIWSRDPAMVRIGIEGAANFPAARAMIRATARDLLPAGSAKRPAETQFKPVFMDGGPSI
jgi:hypothetical protein